MKKEKYLISGKSNKSLLDELDLKVNKVYDYKVIINKLYEAGRYYWDEYGMTCECDKTIIAWNDTDDDCDGGIIRLWRQA